MRLSETTLPGAYLLVPDPQRDERGYFARVWSADDLAGCSLNTTWVQSSISFNETARTLRGMHYQAAPHGEVKLVRCSSGAVFDVIIDLREDSPTWGRWFSVELNAENNLVLYVPEGGLAKFKARPSFSGIPFLAPWANRLDQPSFYANGKKYIFNPGLGNVRGNGPMHGFLNTSNAWKNSA